MKIAIVGSGAMGSLIGGLLVKNDQDIIFIDPWKEHVNMMNKKGLYMEETGKEGEYIKVKAITDVKNIETIDVIILLVKGTKTIETIKSILPVIDEDTIVITFQNGIGNMEKIAKYANEDNIGFGVIDFSAVLTGPGQITYELADGEIACNTYTGEENTRFTEFIKIMNSTGFNGYISEDANYRIWNKLVINANYNVLSGILGITMGELIDEDYAWELMKGITKELVEVANKKGVGLNYEDSLKHIKELGTKVRAHYPSLSQDVARKVPTEIDSLNGAIVREGEKLGIDTPYNKTVYNLMKIIENTYEVGKDFIIKVY